MKVILLTHSAPTVSASGALNHRAACWIPGLSAAIAIGEKYETFGIHDDKKVKYLRETWERIAPHADGAQALVIAKDAALAYYQRVVARTIDAASETTKPRAAQ